MSYGKRGDDRRSRSGPMGKEEYTTYATKGDKERMSREKPKVDTKRLAALRSKDKKDPTVSDNVSIKVNERYRRKKSLAYSQKYKKNFPVFL